MTQFEYVSVGIALVYSFAVARIVSALPAILAPRRRYWVHSLWAFILLLAAVFTWWSIWTVREVHWTPLRFTWVLTVPALIHARAGVLVSEHPGSVESWRTHYFENRVPFFVIGVLVALNGAAFPWIVGAEPWRAPSWIALLIISSAGLLSEKPPIHAVVVTANLVLIILSIMVPSWTA